MRFFITTCLLCALCPATIYLPVMQNDARADYIVAHKEIAIKQMELSGIPASIILAQACIESGNGTSRLAIEANNHFGIKCHNWNGETISHDDDLKGECFRKYGNEEQSFRDHSDFLRFNARYKNLFNLDPKDYKGWAYGLKECGYATNPDYAMMIIGLIESYNLSQYDDMASSVPPTPAEAEISVKLIPGKGSPLYKISLKRTVYRQNKTAYILADECDTYAYLAKEYNLFKRELLSFNDLKKDEPLAAGTVVYLERKRKQSAKHLDKHVIEDGETMYFLSQKYGVRLKYLYKYNNLASGEEPRAGDIINLRKPKRIR